MLIAKQRPRLSHRSAAHAELALALLKVESAAAAARTAQAEQSLALLKARYAQLVAAARASVTAAWADSEDPLAYVRAELSRCHGMPPRDSTVPAVLADARTAMMLAGCAARPASWRRPGDPEDDQEGLRAGPGRGEERPDRSVRGEPEAQRPLAEL